MIKIGFVIFLFSSIAFGAERPLRQTGDQEVFIVCRILDEVDLSPVPASTIMSIYRYSDGKVNDSNTPKVSKLVGDESLIFLASASSSSHMSHPSTRSVSQRIEKNLNLVRFPVWLDNDLVLTKRGETVKAGFLSSATKEVKPPEYELRFSLGFYPVGGLKGQSQTVKFSPLKIKKDMLVPAEQIVLAESEIEMPMSFYVGQGQDSRPQHTVKVLLGLNCVNRTGGRDLMRTLEGGVWDELRIRNPKMSSGQN